MPRYPQNDREVIDQARISRDRAQNTAKKSSSLIQRAARLEEAVRKTEAQLRELKAIVGNTTKTAFKSRKRRDKRVRPQ